MARRCFNVVVQSAEVMVEVEWSRWSNAGVVKVDGRVVQAWGSGLWVPREITFQVHGQPAKVVRKGLFWEDWALVIGGKQLE